MPMDDRGDVDLDVLRTVFEKAALDGSIERSKRSTWCLLCESEWPFIPQKVEASVGVTFNELILRSLY